MTTIEDLAVQGRLREALNELEPSIRQPNMSWELRKEYHDISSLYDMLLDYFRQGVDDPERGHVFTRLIGRTLILSDKVEATRQQVNRSTGQRVNESTSQQVNKSTGQRGFGAPVFWESADVDNAIQQIRDGSRQTDACLLISDMTLSLLRVFDPRKVEVLCEAVSSECDSVAVRAVTAIAITVRRYGRRLPFYPDVEARLRQLGADTAFLDMLADVELQFVRSRDTEEIERRMKDEIIPSMLRSPKAKGKHIITPEDLTDESNPEWSQWLKESGLEEKLQELTELQMSGADVYMATFAQLKSYPFFSETANWFRPFDPTHPAVSHLFTKTDDSTSKKEDESSGDTPSHEKKPQPPLFSLQSLIMRSGMFCNSDKYSFCLSLTAIPKAQLDMLQAQFAEQEDALREEFGLQQTGRRAGGQGALSPRTLVRQYIQDLYRFFHLCPARSAYADPFADGGSQAPGDALHAFYALPETSLLALFELNLQRRDYPSAITSFDALKNRDVTLWQKYGFCHQRNGNHAEALRAYRMADLLKPDHFWTLHHIAQCQRALGQHTEALESYRHLAAMKPDVPRFTYRQAECLIQLARYDEALPLLYRLVYNTPDDLRALRALVNCLLMQRQPDAAMKQAAHILGNPSLDLTDDDLLLIGSAQWLTGQRDDALRTWAVMERLPRADALLRLGLPDDDIPFLLDLLRPQRQP